MNIIVMKFGGTSVAGTEKIKNIVDISLIVKDSSIPRIQEAHRVIYHIICEIVEEELARIE